MGSYLNEQSLRSFAAEVEILEKLGFTGLPKTLSRTGLLGRAASQVGKALGGVGKGVADIPAAAQETLSLAAHPFKSMAKGWKDSSWMAGKGKVTKYLPFGPKALTVGFAAPGLMEAYEATKKAPTPTGEGGAAEKLLGEVGGTGGFLAGMATKRALPGFALMLAGQYGGGRLGRIIDRLRGGADLGTAVSAPSETEAESQLQDIQRYYG